MRVWTQTDSRVRFAAFKENQNPNHKTKQQKKQTTKQNKGKKKANNTVFHFRTGVAFKGWLWLCFLWRLLGKQELPPQKTHQEKQDSFFISPNTVVLIFRVFCSSAVSMEWFLQGILNPRADAAGVCSEVKIPNLPQTQRSSRARPCSCCVWMSRMVIALLGA